MIYFVTKQQEILPNPLYKIISVDESIQIMKDWKIIQLDTETSGRDPHICKLLCLQLGNDKDDVRIIIDASSIDIKKYKNLIEDSLIIGQNLKFDLQFLYKYEIIPRHVYDTMIVEQLLHLGWPAGKISYSLKEIAYRRLHIELDKTIRGEIRWRGLDSSVIQYAASDVTHLEKIMHSQVKDLKKQELMKAALIECNFIPAIAYLEWCGIHLNRKKWERKMQKDQQNLTNAEKALSEFVVHKPELKKYVYINTQGDLFNGFDLTPKVNINWASSQQVVKIAKILGFDTKVQDKKTGEDKDSVLEKHLKSQKGICDEFLKLYFDYQEHFKVCTSFGQGHLNAINPVTDRIHTVYRQLGAASGRMSCGSQQPNEDLAKLLGISPKNCTYPNCQQLPADEDTRGAFDAPEGYEWCSCDFGALESRLGADIYNEPHMINEFLHGSGDIHSLMTQTFFADQMEKNITTKEIKKKYPELRKKAKAPEFKRQELSKNDLEHL